MVFVFDTNTLVSSIIKPSGKSAQALTLARSKGKLIFSDDTKAELMEVLFRVKFDKYLDKTERLKIANDLVTDGEERKISNHLDIICRDPSDSKFLRLGFDVNVNCIVSGDSDLKELHPFRGIPILTSVEFLSEFR